MLYFWSLAQFHCISLPFAKYFVQDCRSTTSTMWWMKVLINSVLLVLQAIPEYCLYYTKVGRGFLNPFLHKDHHILITQFFQIFPYCPFLYIRVTFCFHTNYIGVASTLIWYYTQINIEIDTICYVLHLSALGYWMNKLLILKTQLTQQVYNAFVF